MAELQPPKIRTIIHLPTTEQIVDKDYFLVEKAIPSQTTTDLITYTSSKVTAKNLEHYMTESIYTNLSNDYGLRDGINFSDLKNRLDALYNGMTAGTILNGQHYFELAPRINEVLTSFIDDDNTKAMNLASVKAYTAANEPLFIGDDTNYMTKYFNVEENKVQTKLGMEYAPSIEDERHNIYIFRLKNKVSNEWTAPCSGLFSCYGWVDMKDGGSESASNYNGWIALEAYLVVRNATTTATEKREWKIINLQPVAKNQYCTYVGFCVPIKSGTKLRLRSGFVVGTNSNKYNGFQGSMTNHIANAFVGGVYGLIGASASTGTLTIGSAAIDAIREIANVSSNDDVTNCKNAINALLNALSGNVQFDSI